MEKGRRRGSMKICLLLLHLTIPAIFIQCDARRSMYPLKGPSHFKSRIAQLRKKLVALKPLDGDSTLLAANIDPYVSSPFSMPPYDSLGPIYYPDQNAPPYCITPPSAPQTPSTTIPSPIGFGYTPIPPAVIGQSPPSSPPNTIPSPMDSSGIPNSPDQTVPSPADGGAIPSPSGTPGATTPNPPDQTVPSPTSGELPSPPYFEPSPPTSISSPSTNIPSPTGFTPSPPVFLPPIVYPPPLGPPSAPKVGPGTGGLWCVAKPSVPDPIIHEAMNYACGSGADCDSIQPSGPCFKPNTLFAHASFAFNSYWQRTKVAGGTCSFGGTAMLVTIDPSFDGCHYMLV